MPGKSIRLVTTATVGRALKMHVPKEVAQRLAIPGGGGIAFLELGDGDIVVRALPGVRPAALPMDGAP